MTLSGKSSMMVQRPHAADTATCTITRPQKGDPCQNCHRRPSTTAWTGDGGALAWNLGFYQWWCDVCALTEQLEHARERAKAIPDLQRRLRNAKRRKS